VRGIEAGHHHRMAGGGMGLGELTHRFAGAAAGGVDGMDEVQDAHGGGAGADQSARLPRTVVDGSGA
jgi:hypothetical protein